MLCKRSYYKGSFIDFLDDPDSYIAKSPLLKDGNSSTVALVEIEGCKYAVKRFNIKNIAKLIRRQFPPSRMRRNWLLGHLLVFNDFRTPEPIAMIEKRFGPFHGVGYIVTEYVDATDIRQSLKDAQGDPVKQETIISCFVSTLKRLHDRGITHGDLKDTNFLYARGRLCIVDLDAMKLHKPGHALEKAIRKDRRRLKQNYQDDPALLELTNRLLV